MPTKRCVRPGMPMAAGDAPLGCRTGSIHLALAVTRPADASRITAA